MHSLILIYFVSLTTLMLLLTSCSGLKAPANMTEIEEFSHEDSEYLFLPFDLTWDEAYLDCQNNFSSGYHIVVIENETESNALATRFNYSSWWIGVRFSTWTVLGEEPEFDDWSLFAVNDTPEVRCVFADEKDYFQWQYDNCSATWPAICEKEITQLTLPTFSFNLWTSTPTPNGSTIPVNFTDGNPNATTTTDTSTTRSGSSSRQLTTTEEDCEYKLEKARKENLTLKIITGCFGGLNLLLIVGCCVLIYFLLKRKSRENIPERSSTCGCCNSWCSSRVHPEDNDHRRKKKDQPVPPPGRKWVISAPHTEHWIPPAQDPKLFTKSDLKINYWLPPPKRIERSSVQLEECPPSELKPTRQKEFVLSKINVVDWIPTTPPAPSPPLPPSPMEKEDHSTQTPYPQPPIGRNLVTSKIDIEYWIPTTPPAPSPPLPPPPMEKEDHSTQTPYPQPPVDKKLVTSKINIEYWIPPSSPLPSPTPTPSPKEKEDQSMQTPYPQPPIGRKLVTSKIDIEYWIPPSSPLPSPTPTPSPKEKEEHSTQTPYPQKWIPTLAVSSSQTDILSKRNKKILVRPLTSDVTSQAVAETISVHIQSVPNTTNVKMQAQPRTTESSTQISRCLVCKRLLYRRPPPKVDCVACNGVCRHYSGWTEDEFFDYVNLE